MARSSGARPKVAVRDQVAALKRKLGTITSDRWQVAQAIMDQICVLCEVRGPSGGLMVPRSCKICKFYGHTSQFCPQDLDRVALQCRREAAEYRPVTEENSTPEQWAWVCELQAIEERKRVGDEKGIGKCTRQKAVTCASQINLQCGCDGCREWAEWMAPVLRAPQCAPSAAGSPSRGAPLSRSE